MTNYAGRYLSKTLTPMLATGHQTDDGDSFVISENGTEEADDEIRRICFGNNNIRVTIGGDTEPMRPTEDDDEAETESRHWTSAITHYRESSEPWTRWASLPTRRKRAAILQYFSVARLFRVVTVTSPGDKSPTRCCFSSNEGRVSEMQITDCDGCPLFDAWLQRFAWSHTGNRWVVEACGNVVLTIQRSAESVLTLDKAGSTQMSLSTKRLFPRSPANHELSKITWRRWTITDWNGDHFGYLVASGSGEAMFLETADKETVCKFIRQCSLSRRLRADSGDLSDFSDNSAPVTTATPRRRARRAVPCVQKVTWTCLHHESGQRLMRLEDDEVACFDAVHGVGLAIKLLILAGIVKIVGDLRRNTSTYTCPLFGDRGRSCCK